MRFATLLGKTKNEKFHVLIQETNLEKMKQELLKILQYNNLAFQIVPSVNHSGGLLTLYDKYTEIEVLSKSQCSQTIRDKKSDSIIIKTYVNTKQYNLQPLKIAIEEVELTCKRSGKTSRIDYILSNNHNITLQRNAIETLPFAFSDHKCLHFVRKKTNQGFQNIWKKNNIVLTIRRK